MSFAPRHPDFAAKVRASFDAQRFMQHVGARLTEIEPGRCTVETDHDPSLTQQHGFFHAGVVATLADDAAGYAAFTLMDALDSILTVEFKVNLVAPAKGDRLVARGEALRSGRTLSTCRADVFVVRDGEEHLCAASQATLMRLVGGFGGEGGPTGNSGHGQG